MGYDNIDNHIYKGIIYATPYERTTIMINLQKEITELIPSEDLKSKIKESGFVMDDRTLLITVLDCAPDFYSRIEYLEKLVSFTQCKTAKAQAQNIIANQKYIHENFGNVDADTIFELHIKESPQDFDNRYLCKTYQDALNMINAFFEYYEFEPNVFTRYKITKRHILSHKFSEDVCGEAEFLWNKSLYSMDDYKLRTEQCNGDCKNCEMYCLNPDGAIYPIFTSNGDLVKYKTNDGNQQYGVIIWFDNSTDSEYACIIPMNTPYMHYQDFGNAHHSHTHIKQTFIEKADYNTLPTELKEIYWEFSKYIKSN